MSQERLSNGETKEYTALSNHNVLDLWGVAGSDWTSTLREECLIMTQQCLEPERSGATRGIILTSVLAFLALLGAATLTQAPITSWISPENVQAASIKLLIP
ncbi:hypothetical protein [Allocoleopsis sp.]|uniref:hypothetical protein n=1 Tax=Allocoleopsis sp. TaxID=3088169 RepID=UPI002FD5D38C